MRIGLLALATLLAAPSVAPAQSPRTGAGLAVLRGVLVDAATGEAVRRARAEVSTGPMVVDQSPAASVIVGRIGAVMSDADGRFSLEVPTGGAVSVRITKAGYAAVMRIVPAADVRESVPQLIALERGAAIVGKAVDLAGEPVPLVGVMIMRARERPGPENLITSVVPDERGEFRLGGLVAGRYTIDNMIGPITVGLRANPLEVQLESGQEIPVVLVFEPIPPGESQAPTSLIFNATTGTLTRTTISAPQPPPGARSVRGVVTSTAGTPLRGASVTAIGRGSVRRGATTDALGRFSIDGLTPGTYTIEATRRGFVRAEHGQRGLDLPGVKVTVESGADVEDVAIVLPAAGAVSGVVYDQVGEPLQDAIVRVVRVRRGPAGLTPVGDSPAVVRTDDRGYFRAGSLLPGEYIATASFSAHVIGDGVRAAYATTFWPAGTDPGGAAPLEVRAAEEITGLAFTLPLVPVFRLSGTVVASTGAPAAGTVRLTLGRGGDPASDTRSTTLGARGEFSFDDVTAGDYVVQALATSGPGGAESGRRMVTVARGDPEALLIRTSRGSSLAGRFVLEGARPGDLMWGYAATAVADGVSWAPATVSNLGSPVADGEPFSLSPLAGPTRMRIQSEDENWYLKSVVIDGFDAADGVFDFGFDGRRYTDVQIVFSRLGATLTGRATDERARPVRDYAVYVFPTDRDKWTPGSRWLAVTRSGADGAFRIPSLPPGSYWTVAVDRVDAVARTADWGDPALLDALTPHAVSVVVGESETRDVTLRVVRR